MIEWARFTENCSNALLVGPRKNVITKALVAEVNMPEFTQKVIYMVDVARAWRNDPDTVFDV